MDSDPAAVPAGRPDDGRDRPARGLAHRDARALPGCPAGLGQGWAFSWWSRTAAEIIASSPALGVGLGQLPENGRHHSSMPRVFLALFLILLVGTAIDLLIFSPLERWVLRSRALPATLWANEADREGARARSRQPSRHHPRHRPAQASSPHSGA